MTEMKRQADFFCGKLNGITFPCSSGGIHFVAFFLKLLRTKNSMIFAINHPTCKNNTEAKKFSFLQNSTNAMSSLQHDIEANKYFASIIACGMGNAKNESMNPKEVAFERGWSMADEGTVRKCPHQELDTGQHCRGTQTFSQRHKPPVGWNADNFLETCSGWMCDLNREHFNGTLPTGEEVLY